MHAITPGTQCPVCGKKHRAGSKPLAACTAKLAAAAEAPRPEGRSARSQVEAAEAPKGYPYEAEGLQRTETRLAEAHATIARFVADNTETPYAVGWVSGSITTAICEAAAWLECSKDSRALADVLSVLRGLSTDIENLWADRETPEFILGFIDQAIQGILEIHYIGYLAEAA